MDADHATEQLEGGIATAVHLLCSLPASVLWLQQVSRAKQHLNSALAQTCWKGTSGDNSDAHLAEAAQNSLTQLRAGVAAAMHQLCLSTADQQSQELSGIEHYLSEIFKQSLNKTASPAAGKAIARQAAECTKGAAAAAHELSHPAKNSRRQCCSKVSQLRSKRSVLCSADCCFMTAARR